MKVTFTRAIIDFTKWHVLCMIKEGKNLVFLDNLN